MITVFNPLMVPIPPEMKNKEDFDPDKLMAHLVTLAKFNQQLLDCMKQANDETLGIGTEGDWTAAFTCGTSGGIYISNSYKTGHYIKIGKMVVVTGYFVVQQVGTGGDAPVGNVSITGLPFICGTGNKYAAAVAIFCRYFAATETTNVMGVINSATSRIDLYKHDGAGGIVNITDDIQANTYFIISATYFTD